MFPVRFGKDQSDELADGFIDDNMSVIVPSGFAIDDGGGYADECNDEGRGGADDVG